MAIKTLHHSLPAFPDNVAMAPLMTIPLTRLESGDDDDDTSAAFFQACKDLGFFYLDLHGSAVGEALIDKAEKLHEVQQQFFRLSVEEKDCYAREKVDAFFGYRFGQLDAVDENGVKLRNETYNMRKDDFLGNCTPLPQPDLIKNHWTLFQDYTRLCRSVIDLLLNHLERHLQLPTGTLANLHRVGQRSGDCIRFNQAAVQPYVEEDIRAGEHTDFGTLTILFNWLGGLQIRSPDQDERWVYVKPVAGAAVVNLGDALVKFTAGLLRSNVHRIAPPPPPQDGLVRNSLVYFSRPEDAVILKRLRGGLIDQQPDTGDDGPEMTAQEWILRRSVGDMKGVFTHRAGLEPRNQKDLRRV